MKLINRKIVNNDLNSLIYEEGNVFLFYDIHNMSKVLDTRQFIDKMTGYILPELCKDENNIGTLVKRKIETYKLDTNVPYLKQEDIPSASVAIVRLAESSDILDLMVLGTNTIFIEYTNGKTRNIFYNTKIDKNNLNMQCLSTMDGYETFTLIKRNFYVAKYIRARVNEVKRIHVLSQEYSNLYSKKGDNKCIYENYRQLIYGKKPELDNGFYYIIDIK